MLDTWVAALFSHLAFIPSGGVETASYAVTVVREHQLCGSCIGRLHSSPVSVLCRVSWPVSAGLKSCKSTHSMVMFAARRQHHCSWMQMSIH